MEWRRWRAGLRCAGHNIEENSSDRIVIDEDMMEQAKKTFSWSDIQFARAFPTGFLGCEIEERGTMREEQDRVVQTRTIEACRVMG